MIFQPQYDQVKIGNTTYRLSHQQYILLFILRDGLEHSVVELAKGIRDGTCNRSDVQTVRVLMSQLRKRIGYDRIVTTRGGYQYVEDYDYSS